MKKVLLILLMIISSICHAQERMNKLSINPFQLYLLNVTNFEYERGFNNGKLGVSLFYGNTGQSTRKVNGYFLSYTEQSVSVKGYLANMGVSSFWFGGQLAVTSSNLIDDDNRNNYAIGLGTLGALGKVGYQFVFGSFVLDFYGGGGYAITNDLFGNARFGGDVTETRLLLIYGFRTGIAF